MALNQPPHKQAIGESLKKSFTWNYQQQSQVCQWWWKQTLKARGTVRQNDVFVTEDDDKEILPERRNNGIDLLILFASSIRITAMSTTITFHFPKKEENVVKSMCGRTLSL